MTGFRARPPVPAQPPRLAAPPPPKFVTVAEIAGRLRVSKMTVYRLIDCGELQAIRVGRSLRVTESAVLAWMRGAEVGR